MLYDLVLKSGNVFTCFCSDQDNITRMFFEDDVFIVRENREHKKDTWIKKEDVEAIRFYNDEKHISQAIE